MCSVSIGSFILYPRYHQYQHLVRRPIVFVSLFYWLVWINNTDKKATKTIGLSRWNEARVQTASFKYNFSLTAVLPQQRNRIPPFKDRSAPTSDSQTDHGKHSQTGPDGPMPAHRKRYRRCLTLIFLFFLYELQLFSDGFVGFF